VKVQSTFVYSHTLVLKKFIISWEKNVIRDFCYKVEIQQKVM